MQGEVNGSRAYETKIKPGHTVPLKTAFNFNTLCAIERVTTAMNSC